MTVTNSSNKTIIQGNASTTVFTFGFEIDLASQLFVIYTDTLGNETVLSSGLYTVTGLGGSSGGTVTYPLTGPPIALGTSLTILRLVQYEQLTSIANQGAFYPAVIEKSVDYLTFLTQQLAEQSNRSLNLNITSTTTVPVLANPVANAVLIYSADGTQVVPGPAVGNIAGDVAAAAASASAAATSATSAAASATASGVSATASAASAAAAAASAASIAAGPVQTVSGVTANGIAVTVTNPSTTPAITVTQTAVGSSGAIPVQGYMPTNYQTGTSYTFVLGDMGKAIDLNNASSITCTIPPHSSVAAPAEAEALMYQSGSGQVTPTAGAGVTLLFFNSTSKLAGQGASAVAKQTSTTNTWRIIGNTI